MFHYRLSYYLTHPIALLNDIEREIAYRTYDKYQVVDTGLDPGYYDKDTLILHANFALLVDFVECELYDWTKKPTLLARIERFFPLFIARSVFPNRKSAKDGLKHIEMRIKDHKKPFSKDDKNAWGKKEDFEKWQKQHLNFWLEVKSLYLWWTKERPARPDDHDVVGLTAFREEMKKKYNEPSSPRELFKECKETIVARQNCWDKLKTKLFGSPPRREKLYFLDSPLSKKDRVRERALYKKLHKLETARDQEDTDNLIRLIKIRQSMWT